jgi:type IV secretion system protein VirB10
MSLFRTPDEPASPETAAEAAPEAIAGDRGIPQVNRARSVQSRLSSLLAFGLMCALGLGFLTWYYARALARPAQAHQAAQAAAKAHAQGEMSLPALGRIELPRTVRADPGPAAEAQASAFERAIGPAPPPPADPMTPMPLAAGVGAPPPPSQKTPGELAFERRLAGPAFAKSSVDSGGGAAGAAGGGGALMPAVNGNAAAGDGSDPLQALLKPTLTPAVMPSVLPTRRFLLAKGAFIDCTLETAIDSTLPGMTTCITATDTFSADGSVVLLERGTKLVGETRGQVAQGTSRIFVLWSEARTPTGVVVPLSSPGTDELGRSGLSGEVNRHFWDRFGAAILLTVINGAVQGAVNSKNSSGSVVISPSTSTDVMTEVLRSTVGIPPTVTKAQGDRIQVFVARDVDFRSVYALRLANAQPVQTPDSSP